MDVLAGLLEGPRARGAFMIRALFDPPWSVRIADEAPLSVMVMVRGSAWLRPEDGTPARRVHPGDVAIARGPDHYTCAGERDTAPFAEIRPGQHCVPLDGAPVARYTDLGLRAWGESRDGSVEMLIGTYQMRGELTGRLLDALPPLLVLPTEVWDCPLTPLLAEEISRADPGQEVVLDRLLDLLLIAALRAWFSRPEAEAPAWYRAMGDPVVGRALRLLQDDPAHPWTIADLAVGAGVSRAALARRFTGLVGEPPMTYLTNWRLALAADLLRDSGLTIAAVARKVGYGSAFALSGAFKRVYGVSPQEHRGRGGVA
ncbi:AraC family transcriptional regulator [Streptomyces alfalfae]|uniref:AraC family transcriptional regulator n=1 Tax=Streptomyces alfalfae TaxID=1642299 RepID=A0ABN4VE27_9ACTN|nr:MULTISPECIES: AraC family transcriptional regulator [Streptomyces]AYA16090.1 AraC family transcriptional regulator [Streptomyces fradiae]APY85731.1 AraC family transcriptional regulator [Streptomyces alfalfae]KUL54385.1 AraC family transcriptional regulator [Streptomyces sp. NRRL S-1521]RXX39561.1 AraC family transcriptional regulator [Streptomyces alfalfae]RZN03646.1 AraC family transcriptional regulator [Streptomyces alfalfae]